MYLFILWPFYLLLNLWAFMFCYIFSIQLKKPQSWHRMKKSHKVKKHRERFNCLFLIFFSTGINLWRRLNVSVTLQWGQRKCTAGTPPETAAQLLGTHHSPVQSHPKTRAHRCQGWCQSPAHPIRIPTGNRNRICPRLHTACAAAMHKLTRVLYPNTAALSDLPSIAAKCRALLYDSKWG